MLATRAFPPWPTIEATFAADREDALVDLTAWVEVRRVARDVARCGARALCSTHVWHAACTGSGWPCEWCIRASGSLQHHVPLLASLLASSCSPHRSQTLEPLLERIDSCIKARDLNDMRKSI